ncbi:type II toxin-antitoxin system VapC family toxin [Geotalea uraniireducens]|uniref:Ribonuclease VapC n=1 Tax=Geotalea uraniireducens (strain Rf4) TaxID=351605 RepID=A5GDU9_GEOUR|nr:type II toxin-antitoxin system VapC family toxin [Geotalea uraniireducens]ABQ24256.1 PilT protein domain protein [Geotalea uraniireducens Rf4]
MGFLIDTCIWIDVERGTLAPADVAAVTGEEPVYLSPVTIAELKFGAENAKTADLRQKRLAALTRLKRKPLLMIDETTGEIFGDIAAQIRKHGKQHQYRVQDLWLASQAVQHGFRFLTHNRKDFADIPGLQLIVWSDAFSMKARQGE